jgi:hypothetical protein
MAQDIEIPVGNAHRSPPMGMVALIYVTLFLAGMVVTSVMTGGAPYPVPYQPILDIQAYYTRFPDVIRIGSFFQFGASIPLGLFTATVVSRLQFHRINVAGVHVALFGGIAASLLLAVSALTNWTMSQPGIATDAGALRSMELLAFATGGFGNVAATGLLLAGVSVPCLFVGLMPRWACWLGLVIAGIAEVSTLSMIFPALSILLPLGRFPSFIWMLVAGFTIPKQRKN